MFIDDKKEMIYLWKGSPYNSQNDWNCSKIQTEASLQVRLLVITLMEVPRYYMKED